MNPTDLLCDLLDTIRNQFYPDSPKAFFQQRDALILCLTRPAQWFSDRGVIFPPRRYQQLLQEILQTIKRHGDTGQIRWWPAYLGKAVEAHLVHHGDELYQEAKGARNLAELALARVKKEEAGDPQEDIITTLAEARRILLQTHKKRARKPSAPARQTDLPGLENVLN